MKLRANIERMPAKGFMPAAVKVTFAAGEVYAASVERMIERNVGPRPWAEVSFWKNGRLVVIYCK